MDLRISAYSDADKTVPVMSTQSDTRSTYETNYTYTVVTTRSYSTTSEWGYYSGTCVSLSTYPIGESSTYIGNVQVTVSDRVFADFLFTSYAGTSAFKYSSQDNWYSFGGILENTRTAYTFITDSYYDGVTGPRLGLTPVTMSMLNTYSSGDTVFWSRSPQFIDLDPPARGKYAGRQLDVSQDYGSTYFTIQRVNQNFTGPVVANATITDWKYRSTFAAVEQRSTWYDSEPFVTITRHENSYWNITGSVGAQILAEVYMISSAAGAADNGGALTLYRYSPRASATYGVRPVMFVTRHWGSTYHQKEYPAPQFFLRNAADRIYPFNYWCDDLMSATTFFHIGQQGDTTYSTSSGGGLGGYPTWAEATAAAVAPLLSGNINANVGYFMEGGTISAVAHDGFAGAVITIGNDNVVTGTGPTGTTGSWGVSLNINTASSYRLATEVGKTTISNYQSTTSTVSAVSVYTSIVTENM